MMQIELNIGTFISETQTLKYNFNLRTFIYNLVFMVPTIKVEPSGQVSYVPQLGAKEGKNWRTTSLTRLCLWYNRQLSDYHQFKGLTPELLQPVQDAFIKWVGENATTDRWTFEEVKGEDIIGAYRVGPYSCMQGKVGQLALYVENPEKVSLLKIMDKGTYVGRAILWTTDSGKRMLDRIYPGNGVIAFAGRAYAKSQGWLYQSVDSVGNSNNLGEDVDVTLKHPTNARIAYLDSLMYVAAVDRDNLVLTNRRVDDSGDGILKSVGDYEARETRLYGRWRTTNGGYYVRKYGRHSRSPYYTFSEPDYGYVAHYRRTLNAPLTTRFIMNDEKVIYDADRQCFLPASIIVEIDHITYFRADVRKVRNTDEYRPKAGAVPLTTGIYTTANGTKVVSIKRGE